MEPVIGSFSGTGQSAAISPVAAFAPTHGNLSYFNLTIYGTFSATVKLERSFDSGSTWHVVSKDADGAEAAWTAPCSLPVREPEPGVVYRLNCTAYTSGTVNYRLSA